MKNKNINSFLKWFFLIGFLFFLVFNFVTKENIYKSSSVINKTDLSDIKYVKIAGIILKTELALTPEAHAQGLSGRKELKNDESMLFVFNHTDKYSFWMKDMNFPIDIIWIGEDLRVVYIKKNASPESYPEAFTPNQDAMYILEVFSSFSEKNNLKVGDKVEFLSS